MKARSIFAALVLLPCSKIYGVVTYLRNKMFDWKILRETSFDVPIITVGNLAVGGTGKTPTVEYLAAMLRRNHKVAVLSRGYRRRTKGFIMAGANTSPRDIGDEAYQVYHKFGGDVTVVVCEDRVAGINELLRLKPDIDMIILDDAFQHRYVKPTISIVITEYAHPIYRDKMLPYGRLREPARGINRADMVIISKCPTPLKPYDYRQEINEYELFPSQDLFFSHYDYLPLQPVFPELVFSVPYLDWLTENDSVLAVAGIGNPRPFIRHIKSFAPKVKVDIFPDHHQYTRKDIEHLLKRFRSLKGNQRILVTTEKDAVRLAANPYFPHELKASTFFLPVKIDFDYVIAGPTFEEAIEKLLRERCRK